MEDLAFAAGRLRLIQDAVARLTIAAPATRNAMAQAMWRALPEILARVTQDTACRALILTGEGRAFCAGADISEFEVIYATRDSALAANADIRSALAALRDLPLPVIAAVSGPCVGGGVALALAADHVIAAPDAVFAIPPARLGIGYSPEDTAMLLERISAPRAKELLMTARRLTADEALNWGLIDRIAPDPLAAAQDHAAGLAQLSAASIRHAKACVNALAKGATDQTLADSLAALFSGVDFIEGRRAFLDRRPPKF